MAVYTKKKGQYRKLTREEVRKLQRLDKVVPLQKAAIDAAPALAALATWLKHVENHGNKLTKGDLVVAKLPNRNRLLRLAEGLSTTARALK